jgi:hypothetical protein
MGWELLFVDEVKLQKLLNNRAKCRICTLDSDFTIYRKHGREPLALIMPPRISQ